MVHGTRFPGCVLCVAWRWFSLPFEIQIWHLNSNNNVRYVTINVYRRMYLQLGIPTTGKCNCSYELLVGAKVCKLRLLTLGETLFSWDPWIRNKITSNYGMGCRLNETSILYYMPLVPVVQIVSYTGRYIGKRNKSLVLIGNNYAFVMHSFIPF